MAATRLARRVAPVAPRAAVRTGQVLWAVGCCTARQVQVQVLSRGKWTVDLWHTGTSTWDPCRLLARTLFASALRRTRRPRPGPSCLLAVTPILSRRGRACKSESAALSQHTHTHPPSSPHARPRQAPLLQRARAVRGSMTCSLPRCCSL